MYGVRACWRAERAENTSGQVLGTEGHVTEEAAKTNKHEINYKCGLIEQICDKGWRSFCTRCPSLSPPSPPSCSDFLLILVEEAQQRLQLRLDAPNQCCK